MLSLGLYCPQSTTTVPVKSGRLISPKCVFIVSTAANNTTKDSCRGAAGGELMLQKIIQIDKDRAAEFMLGKCSVTQHNLMEKNVLHKHCDTALVGKFFFIDWPVFMPKRSV